MKTVAGILIAVAILGMTAAWSQDTGYGVRQTVCPVLGKQINTKYYVDYRGKRIYTCCSVCLREVRKNPAKYVAKLQRQGTNLNIED